MQIQCLYLMIGKNELIFIDIIKALVTAFSSLFCSQICTEREKSNGLQIPAQHLKNCDQDSCKTPSLLHYKNKSEKVKKRHLHNATVPFYPIEAGNLQVQIQIFNA